MKDTNSSLLLRLFLILVILIVIARSCGSPREGEVKAYTWNKEKNELEELDVYEGDDFIGMLEYTFGDWFEPEETDEE